MKSPYKYSLTFPTYRGEVINRKFKKTENGFVSDYWQYFYFTEEEFKLKKKREPLYSAA